MNLQKLLEGQKFKHGVFSGLKLVKSDYTNSYYITEYDNFKCAVLVLTEEYIKVQAILFNKIVETTVYIKDLEPWN